MQMQIRNRKDTRGVVATVEIPLTATGLRTNLKLQSIGRWRVTADETAPNGFAVAPCVHIAPGNR
jgi:hypothetical protein